MTSNLARNFLDYMGTSLALVLNKIDRGKTGTVNQLLGVLSKVNIILPQRKEILIDSDY